MDKLIEKFGCKIIDTDLKKKFPNSLFIERDIFCMHRDLDKIGDDFYIYTGRGPSSSSLHLGHLVPFMFAKELQDIYNVHVIIQITDDEKFYRDDKTLTEIRDFGKENMRNIISCGFNLEKTTIFFNSSYQNSDLDLNVIKISKLVKLKDIISSFGFTDDMNIGSIFFPVQQMAPSFSSSFQKILGIKKPCLIIAGIDQDPYFRLVRDIAEKIGELKPSVIYANFLPGIFTKQSKMSSSNPLSAIFLEDSNSEIEKKIKKSFSGGQDTLENHVKFGGNTDVDICIEYLRFFVINKLFMKVLKPNLNLDKLHQKN